MTRRRVLSLPAAVPLARGQSGRRPRVACILNAYFPNSHADVFMSRLLEGYRLNGESHRPRLEVASFYVDQFPVNDMAREQAAEYGIRIYPSVAEALRLGGRRLAVDAVAVIGEHGRYPRTPRGNFMYPRFRYFQEVTRVMREDQRVVPMYNDKYFAYEWADALRMYRTVKEMRIPFLCGSTLPLTWRRPPLEFQPGIELEEALAVSSSDLEEHAYHGIELLQGMVERRRGGETGVASVRCVEGPEVWKLGEAGEWSRPLLDAALSRRVSPPPEDRGQTPQAILVRYRSGLKASILNLNSLTRDYLFAARGKGRSEPLSSCFYIQLYLHNHWSFMVRNFENLVLTGREPNPIERTLLATGILLFGLESRRQGQRWLETPELDVRY
ncbi:MAG TPA: hypothetical protein VFA33_12280 [Bryobacteraceae bacterium]|nr:hypothetical protein [Bryobacteraceae bacterium]